VSPGFEAHLVARSAYDKAPIGMTNSSPRSIGAASAMRQDSTGKERDETGLDYFGARYYSGAQGRFTSPDPLYFQAEMLSDPQRFNLYAYTRNNPLKFVDSTGRYIELIGDEDERNEMLAALQAGVGTEAGKYLKIKKKRSFFGLGKDHYYVDVTDKKGLAGTNAVANKLSGIINDADREATLRFVDPATKIMTATVGSMDKGQTPGATVANFMQANVSIVRGDIGSMPGSLMEDGKDREANLSQVIVHEFGHVDATWYHGSWDTNGDAVRIENQVRQIQGVPIRIGHDKPRDVRLGPSQY
jgi:RHS repeat-associated protein